MGADNPVHSEQKGTREADHRLVREVLQLVQNLTVRHAAEVTGLSVGAIQRWREALPAKRITDSVRDTAKRYLSSADAQQRRERLARASVVRELLRDRVIGEFTSAADIEAATGVPEDVVRALTHDRVIPADADLDALEKWAQENGVDLQQSTAGAPTPSEASAPAVRGAGVEQNGAGPASYDAAAIRGADWLPNLVTHIVTSSEDARLKLALIAEVNAAGRTQAAILEAIGGNQRAAVLGDESVGAKQRAATNHVAEETALEREADLSRQRSDVLPIGGADVGEPISDEEVAAHLPPPAVPQRRAAQGGGGRGAPRGPG